jgi:hypothetical protein
MIDRWHWSYFFPRVCSSSTVGKFIIARDFIKLFSHRVIEYVAITTFATNYGSHRLISW